jgi:hypothetical protein
MAPVVGRLKYEDLKHLVKRVTLELVPGVKTEFIDRDRALARVVEWAERSTRFPVVIFGPEGCGKSAFLRQAAEALGGFGFDVVYVDAAHRDFVVYTDVAEVARRLLDAASDVSSLAQLKLAYLAVDLAKELIGRWGKKKVAVLVDEVFQAVGLDKTGIYVKSLLNLIEYPPKSYEKIVAIAVISEGVTREELGDTSGLSCGLCGTCRGRASGSCMRNCRGRSLLSRRRGGGSAATRECWGGKMGGMLRRWFSG